MLVVFVILYAIYKPYNTLLCHQGNSKAIACQKLVTTIACMGNILLNGDLKTSSYLVFSDVSEH